METTIKLKNDLKQRLDSLKVHPRESYNEVILRILDKCNSIDEESLVETIEVLSDPEAMRDIAEALEEISKGNYGTSLNDFEKELGLKNVRG